MSLSPSRHGLWFEHAVQLKRRSLRWSSDGVTLQQGTHGNKMWFTPVWHMIWVSMGLRRLCNSNDESSHIMMIMSLTSWRGKSEWQENVDMTPTLEQVKNWLLGLKRVLYVFMKNCGLQIWSLWPYGHRYLGLLETEVTIFVWVYLIKVQRTHHGSNSPIIRWPCTEACPALLCILLEIGP